MLLKARPVLGSILERSRLKQLISKKPCGHRARMHSVMRWCSLESDITMGNVI